MRLRLSLMEGHESVAEGASEHVFDERGGVIGRSDECDWKLTCPHKLISRRHALVIQENGEFIIYDASANGLYHNGSEEPVGIGQAIALQHGDALRMGDYTIAVSLEGCTKPDLATSDTGAEPVDDHAVAELPKPMAATFVTQAPDEQQPAALDNPMTDLGDSTDQYQPPGVLIPEDWDLTADGETKVGIPLVAHLDDSVEESVQGPAEALWTALGAKGRTLPLNSDFATAIGHCLRMNVVTVFRLKAELKLAEQRMAGPAETGGSESAEVLVDYPDAGAFLSALNQAETASKRQRLLAELTEAQADLQARQGRLLTAMSASLVEVAEQFAPEQVEQQYAQFVADRGHESWLERLRRRRNPGVIYWGFYRSWYASQRRTAFVVLSQVLQKNLKTQHASRR